MSVLSLAEAKRHLKLSAAQDSVQRDADVQATIDAAETTIADRVGPLSPVTVTERVTGYGDTLILTRTPVVSITSIVGVSGSAVVVSDLLADDALTLDGLVRYTNATSLFTAGAYDVTYEAGWDPLPADLKNAIKELVWHLWEPRRSTGRTTDEQNSDARSPDAVPKSVADLLEHYEADEQGFA